MEQESAEKYTRFTKNIYFIRASVIEEAQIAIQLLDETFNDSVILRHRYINLLPRSCNLTTVDYFLRAYMKNQVYKKNPQ